MIAIKDVSFVYQGSEWDGIRHVDLEITPGECVLLCGRSGCGKTTVTRLANGLIPYFYPGELTGEVTVNGMDIQDTPMYRISEKIGSVFQNPRSQFFNVDTDSEIAFGMENLSYPPELLRERVESTAGELRIESLRGRGIFELSGGEKQKIAFASVYAMSPDVYVLDEPSSNLDVAAVGELRKILLLLKRQGKTILITEHRLYYLKDIADRIVYMERGSIGGIYTQEQFLSIPAARREAMGLRTMDLRSVKPAPKHAPRAVPALEIRELALYHKKQAVMSGIGLTAARGEIIGVIGRNGAGKSTFSRALCGLHKECEGVFLWEGKTAGPKQRLKLSYMVMQDVNFQLFAESVEKECCFGIKNPDAALAEQTLKELGLYEYRDSHPGALSGGQKQRTAVAVSMICAKEILVFDEPTSGLDFDSMVRVSKLIESLAHMGRIIFVVTHDYEFISAACSRVVCFDGGRVKDDFPVNRENLGKLRDYFIFSQRRDCII
ncbi:MAG: energy-coupling factor ABC transporter ATP-binding protein [Clostridiaceae bacterium]|nr:energy-coupling factor ABC transporter ATP-binding protein [Clostridiaceae bacterium]